jgi:ferrous iron transport protein A
MMPLPLADPGEELVIRKVGGKPEVRKHLEDIGFLVGGSVELISVIGGSVIVKVKGTRVALNQDMAQKIMV